jgi:hypothetical protein
MIRRPGPAVLQHRYRIVYGRNRSARKLHADDGAVHWDLMSPTAIQLATSLATYHVFMGWLNPNPSLDAGEDIAWRRACGMVVRATTSGGILYVAPARVLFVPKTNFPRRILRERHVWPLTDVENIEVAAPDYKLDYAGGMHKRLRLSLRSGDTILFRFAVKKLDQVANELRTLILGPPKPDTQGTVVL